MADYAGASLHGALGIMMALFARERTGSGQHVDVSYLDTTISLLAATPNMRFFFSDGMAPRRGEGFLGGSYPYYAIYETRDGKLLTIGCTEPWLWENFCSAIDRPDFARFARKPDQFVRAANAEEDGGAREIEAIIRTRDRDDWYERLVKADVCVGKVYEPEEMVTTRRWCADMIVDIRASDAGHGARVRHRHQALRDAGHDPQRGADVRRAHRRGAPRPGPLRGGDPRPAGEPRGRLISVRPRRPAPATG